MQIRSIGTIGAIGNSYSTASKNKMKPRERYYTLEDLNIIRMDYFHAIKKFSCYEDFIAAIAPMFHSKEAMIKFQKQVQLL